jgi:membrane protease YdiL (CAAX protease family)
LLIDLHRVVLQEQLIFIKMKILLKIFTILLILGIIATLFIWMLYHASGHKIPADTDAFYRNILIGLVLLLIGTIYFRIKNS